MKKFIHLSAFIFLSLNANAQIKKAAIAEEAMGLNHGKYDSTENFLGNKPLAYIGQELYLIEKPESSRNDGYDNFIKDPRQNKDTKWNVYNCCEGGGNTRYKTIAGKTFKVLDVIPQAALKPSNKANKDIFFLKLEEKESKNILYFVYNSNYRNYFPFVTLGFFEKLKATEIGTVYVLRGKNWISKTNDLLDIKTGKSIVDYSPKTNWKVADIAIEEKYYTLSLILVNERHETLALDVDRSRNLHWAVSERSLDSLTLAIGEEHLTIALKNKVALGMNKSAAILAWGEPKKINETIVDGLEKEQWVYLSDSYLYFTNGRLTGIQ